jgi:carboxypeptidase Q
MKRTASVLALAVTTITPVAAQTFPTDDPVVRAMWEQGMGSGSQVHRLAQALLDSVGPRLAGTEGYDNAVDWALRQYASWDVPARREQYGTWRGWRRGRTVLELTAPRYRQLEATMLGYSPGTSGSVEGAVVVLPQLPDSAAYQRWLDGLDGELVMISAEPITCRPAENWVQLARPQTAARIAAMQDSIARAWGGRAQNTGRGFLARLDRSGAAAVLSSTWSAGWGVNKVFDTDNARLPDIDVSCEDYGLLYRLADNDQSPRLRLEAESEALGERPAYNLIAEMRGTELPDEYVVLSAHFDSFDSSSGATDNGTGALMMMEAMRILKATYPNPRRTILVGLWGAEEMGLIGSRAFAEDHPEVSEGLQIGFNQDNGTWRIEAIRMQGFDQAEVQVQRWLDRMPREIADTVAFTSPMQEGGSDHTSFACGGVPFVRLQANYPDYRQYTWHTNRDSFDKISFDDLRNNATLAAMLMYFASEDPERVSRVRSPLPPDAQGRVAQRPACATARRSY